MDLIIVRAFGRPDRFQLALFAIGLAGLVARVAYVVWIPVTAV